VSEQGIRIIGKEERFHLCKSSFYGDRKLFLEASLQILKISIENNTVIQIPISGTSWWIGEATNIL
jgi:hypothetical protein